MQIIARFPALPPESREVRAVAVVEVRAPDAAAHGSPRPSLQRVRRASSQEGTVRPTFPVRSVLALVVVAVVAWSLALKNDAARRHAARLAHAPAETVPR